MNKMNKNLIIGVIAAGSALLISEAATAQPSNPMLICFYTSATFTSNKPNSIIGFPISTAQAIYTTVGGKPTWSATPMFTITKIPGKGTRVCSSEYSGSAGWDDVHFGYTDPITYHSVGLLNGGLTNCEVRNLVTSRSQIGYGIQYALHYSLISADIINGRMAINKCVVSNVDVDK